MEYRCGRHLRPSRAGSSDVGRRRRGRSRWPTCHGGCHRRQRLLANPRPGAVRRRQRHGRPSTGGCGSDGQSPSHHRRRRRRSRPCAPGRRGLVDSPIQPPTAGGGRGDRRDDRGRRPDPSSATAGSADGSRQAFGSSELDARADRGRLRRPTCVGERRARLGREDATLRGRREPRAEDPVDIDPRILRALPAGGCR